MMAEPINDRFHNHIIKHSFMTNFDSKKQFILTFDANILLATLKNGIVAEIVDQGGVVEGDNGLPLDATVKLLG